MCPKRVSWRRSVNVRAISVRPKKASRVLLLHSRDFFLERLDQWNVPVDDEIQHCVQHIVRALAEEIWRLFQVLAQEGVIGLSLAAP